MQLRTALLSAFTVMALTAPVYSNAAFAADDTISLPPAGTTILNLSVTERTKMGQDTLNASLRYEFDASSANEVQDRINKLVAEAVAEAKKVPAVKTTTGYYQVYVYDQNDSIDPATGRPLKVSKKWRGSQSVDLEATDATKLLELAGKIQTLGFTMSGLTYSLSPDKADTARDELMQKALKKLGEKAKLAQTALGKNSYDILDVNVDGAQQYYPQPKMMMMARAEMAGAADAVAAPVAEAGEQEVSLTLNARVLLKQ